MQEFTTAIKNLTKGLKPVNVSRDTGFLQDCLNLQPMPGEKLEQIKYLQFPPVFVDVYEENSPPIAREDFFFLYQNETLDGNVLYNDADWNAETFAVVSVNGEAENVGLELTLDDGGATCTINADGSLHFEPGPDYDLDVDESHTLTLTYEVSDGTDVAEGTVKIVVWGVYVEPVAPPPPAGDYLLLINPVPGEETIIERGGKVVEIFGSVSMYPGFIGMAGGYFTVGEPGDFDLLYNGQHDWTLELIYENDGAYDNVLCACFTDTAGFYIVIAGTEAPVYAGINSLGSTVIGGTSFASYELLEGPNHIALTFNAAAPEDGIQYYANGHYVGYFMRNTVDVPTPDFSSDIGGTMMFGFTSPSFMGAIFGIRLSDSILYSGTESFTPPTEF